MHLHEERVKGSVDRGADVKLILEMQQVMSQTFSSPGIIRKWPVGGRPVHITTYSYIAIVCVDGFDLDVRMNICLPQGYSCLTASAVAFRNGEESLCARYTSMARPINHTGAVEEKTAIPKPGACQLWCAKKEPKKAVHRPKQGLPKGSGQGVSSWLRALCGR